MSKKSPYSITSSSASPSIWKLAAFGIGALLTSASSLVAQHEVDDDAADMAPIRISGNENAFGYSQMAMMAIMEDLPNVNRYAFTEGQVLREALAAREGVPTDYIIATGGSGPILQMAALAIAEPGKNMITVAPGYMQLTRTFEAAGGEVKTIPVNDKLGYDLEAIKAAIDENTVLVYLCNPNNPTGTKIDPTALKAFITELPESIVAFVDEAYLELADGGLEENSMIDLLKAGENIIIARTFSKVYGMAGIRVGYGIMDPEMVKKLRLYHMGGPNRLGIAAAVASLADTAFFDDSVMKYRAVRKMVTDKLDELEIEYADAQGSFVFIKTGIPIKFFQSLMEDKNLLVGRPFPPYLDWCRVSIGTEEEMAIFLEEFENVMIAQGKLAAN
ncbi:histidinol-phosphate aminotransferase family protein [Puniceicoccaceae bacterium K14]|nr:histidinol-phosphate aminotransferase family protein [Puniceicoccaceae bacterium K14]